VCNIERDAPHDGWFGERRPSPRPLARVFASYAFTSTALRFDGEKRVDLTRHAVFAGSELPLATDLSLSFGAGGVLAGTIDRYDLGPGTSLFFGTSWRAIDERDAPAFLQANTTLSVTRTATSLHESFTAFDLRASLVAGHNFGNVFTPYAVLRGFGGPVYWAGDIGSDVYKYQVGAGFSLMLPSRLFDFFVEGIPLGERGIAAGLGTTLF
jgi:hypothetical protein